MTSGRVRMVTWVALWVSLPLGSAIGIVRILLSGFALRPIHAFPVLAVSILAAVPIALGAILASVAVSAGLRRLGRDERVATLGAVALVSVAPAIFLFYSANRELPGFLTAQSLVGNLALVAGVCGVAAGIACATLRWNRSEAEGQPPSWFALALLVLGVLVPYAVSGAVQARHSGPSVILLLVDALRFDHLGTYGYVRPTSPNIDRLAADSVVFEQALSASSFTKTSIASLLTGLDPHAHGVFRGGRQDTPDRISSDVLNIDHTTLAEALSRAGWLTGAWVQNAQIKGFMGFGQGFARYLDNAGRIRHIHRDFLRWHDSSGRWSPFFAYLHYIDLHDPYRPLARFEGLYGQHGDPYAGIDLSSYGNWSKALSEIREGTRKLDESDVAQLRADYDEAIHGVDEAVGELLDALKARGTYDESIIVLTSDHGDGFMEHGFISHATTPYDELVRVPLIIKLPRSSLAGTRVPDQVRAVDVAPTLLDLLGLPALPGVDGVSLRPMMEGGLERGGQGDDSTSGFVEETDTVGIRTADWKVIYFIPEGRWEIYDLTLDPGEQQDLSSSPPEETAELRARVLAAATLRAEQQVDTVPLDPETVRSLRALGYLE